MSQPVAIVTGAGKPLCYQVPAMLMPGMTVIVSPLIASHASPARGARRNRGVVAMWHP